MDYSFYQDVYDVVRLVPAGRVTSYGAIARYLGTGKSARLVGWAMNQAHGVSPPVPAHRVVNHIGLLTGKAHFSGPDRMQKLLEAEGVKVEKERIVDFRERFWDPMVELDLER